MKFLRLILAVVLTIAFLATAMYAGPAPAQAAEETTLSFASHARLQHFVPGAGELPRAEALELAGNVDFIVAHLRNFTAHIPAMKAINPDLVILGYGKGATAAADQGDDFPDSWYLRNAAGNRVQSEPWGSYLMDPRKEGWHDAVVDQCIANLDRSGYDGCYFDVMGVGALSITSTAPVKFAGGPAITEAEWHQWMVDMRASLRAKLPAGIEFMANGLGSGPRWFNSDAPSSELSDAFGSDHAETWQRIGFSPATDFRDLDRYREEIDMLVEAADRGSRVLVSTKLWVNGANNAQRDQWRNFSYASFLLGTDGSHHFAFTGVKKTADDLNLSIYQFDIGVPVGDYTEPSTGVFTRPFANGIVVTNGDDRSRTVSLPAGQFVDHEGTTYEGDISLGANRGLVLQAEGGAPVPECDGQPATIVGTDSAETLIGTAGPDVIYAGDGDDTVEGRGGDDIICGGDGDDFLRGQNGDDLIFGGQGSDRLQGNNGDDILQGGDGDDTLNGGADFDKCWGSGGIDTAPNCERSGGIE